MPTSFTSSSYVTDEMLRAYREAMEAGNTINVPVMQNLGTRVHFRNIWTETTDGTYQVLQDHPVEASGGALESVKCFTERGTIPVNGSISASYTESKDQLTIWASGRAIATLIGQTLFVTRSETSLLPQFKKLAAREGFEIKIRMAIPHDNDGYGVAYWHWQNRKEVDDSELVAVTKPMLESMRVERLNDMDGAVWDYGVNMIEMEDTPF